VRIRDPLDAFRRVSRCCSGDCDVAYAYHPAQKSLVDIDRADVLNHELAQALRHATAVKGYSTWINPKDNAPALPPSDDWRDDQPPEQKVPEVAPPRRANFGQDLVWIGRFDARRLVCGGAYLLGDWKAAVGAGGGGA